MSADLLQTLQILAEFSIDLISKSVASLAIRWVALTVQKPYGNLEVLGLLENAYNALQLFNGELTGPIRILALVPGTIMALLTAC